MNSKRNIRNIISEFFEHPEWVLLVFLSVFLIAVIIVRSIVSFYDTKAVVTAIGHEGITVEYRDRKGVLRSEFMETGNEYHIGDEIIVHVDEWKYGSQQRPLLSDKDKE